MFNCIYIYLLCSTLGSRDLYKENIFIYWHSHSKQLLMVITSIVFWDCKSHTLLIAFAECFCNVRFHAGKMMLSFWAFNEMFAIALNTTNIPYNTCIGKVNFMLFDCHAFRTCFIVRTVLYLQFIFNTKKNRIRHETDTRYIFGQEWIIFLNHPHNLAMETLFHIPCIQEIFPHLGTLEIR